MKKQYTLRELTEKMKDLTIEQQLEERERHLLKLRRAGLDVKSILQPTPEELALMKDFEEKFAAGDHFPLMNSSKVLSPLKKP